MKPDRHIIFVKISYLTADFVFNKNEVSRNLAKEQLLIYAKCFNIPIKKIRPEKLDTAFLKFLNNNFGKQDTINILYNSL